MKIQRAYKYRLFPTPEQEQNLRQQCGNCRFLWNKFLDLNKEIYEATGKFVFGHALITSIPKLKQEYGFLGATFSQSLQQVGRHFDRALREFLDHKKEFPKHKKKKYRDGLTIPQKFRLEKTFVFIPKVGEVQWVKHRPYKGKVKHITIKQDGDQWYCSVSVEIKAKNPQRKSRNIVGIDVGLKTFATLSDGTVVENERILRKYEKKLKKAQRILSRRKKGGSNRTKQRFKVAKLHRKIRNSRNNFLHQTTARMIAKYDGFILEDLCVSGMMKNHCLAKSISDAGWYEFNRQLEYKAVWNGKWFWKIDRFEPSSKTCCECGWVNKNLTLSDRVFRCERCDNVKDRDLNAALNIRSFGIRDLPLDEREITLGDEGRLQSVSGSATRRAKNKECVVLVG